MDHPPQGPDRRWELLGFATIAVGLAYFALFRPWQWIPDDFERLVRAGHAWRSGLDPYETPGFVYTPAAAILGSFLTDALRPVLGVVEITLIVTMAPRNLVAVAVALSFPGTWSDVALGNITVLLVAAAVLCVAADSGPRGLPLGAALALAPKPMFLLFVIWLVRFRPNAFRGLLIGAAMVTGIAVVVAGVAPYESFAETLWRGIPSDFAGNYGLSRISPILGWAGFAVAALSALWLIRASETAGLMASAIAGTFAGTYVGLYSTVLPLACLPTYARAHPRSSGSLAILSLDAPLALPVMAGIGLLVLHLAERNPRPPTISARRSRQGLESEGPQARSALSRTS